MKDKRQKFVNGATLLGTAISLYSFSVLLQVTGWRYWAFIIATFFMLANALIEFCGLSKK